MTTVIRLMLTVALLSFVHRETGPWTTLALIALTVEATALALRRLRQQLESHLLLRAVQRLETDSRPQIPPV